MSGENSPEHVDHVSAGRSRLRFACRFSLQLLDRGFSLVLGQLLLKTLRGLSEAGIAVNFFGAAQQNESYPQKQNESCDLRHRPKFSADTSAEVGRRSPAPQEKAAGEN